MQKNYLRKLLCTVLLGVSFTLSYAQNGSISGTVVDSKSETLPGVSIVIQGTTQGGSADLNGKFRIANVKAGTYTLVASFIGYKTEKKEITVTAGQDVPVNFTLADDAVLLNEAVAIGYGSVQKKDLTGSVTSVNSKDFNIGSATTPEQLVSGKIAGVNITSNGGAPGSGSRIRIRGGTSLNATNDPLIVIDGVPVDNGGISGSPNPLSLINPNDIENITVLKDASAAAIYGNRAANGVILITTKHGASDGKLHVELNSLTSYSQIINYVDVMSADEFRAVVLDTTKTINRNTSTAAQRKLLGTANTNWQKEIFQNAMTYDNNIAISGGLKILPYRLSLGYLSQEGVLKRGTLDRASAGLNLSPSFLQNKLKLDVSAKFSQSKSFFANQGAIGTAVGFDPTQPVHSGVDSLYGGYFEWIDSQKKLVNLAPRNPVGLIEERIDESTVNRFIGNAKIDYTIPFVKGLRAILVLGTDVSHSSGNIFVDSTAASDFTRGGVKSEYSQDKTNNLLDFYLNYATQLSKKNKIDAIAGYSYQRFISESPVNLSLKASGDTTTEDKTNINFIYPSYEENVLLSFYGRINYSYNSKYLLTLTLRNDQSSRFSESERSGIFPSAAFAWRAIDEKFMTKCKVISDLKLRLGWGITGQQEGIGNYSYFANYSRGNGKAQYQFGNGFYTVYRPNAVDEHLTWEKTTTQNAGIDFGFINNRIYGSFDYYKKLTKDLLAVVPTAAGTNFSNVFLTNVGNLENTGIELTLNFIPVSQKNFTWEIGTNVYYNINEITSLTQIKGDTNDILIGGISGIGNTIQVHSIGYAANTFYVYHHLMDSVGNPCLDGIDYNGDGKKNLLDMFQDVNGDGSITAADKIKSKKPEPDFTFGFSTSVGYKNWNIATGLRAQIGNYVYNNVESSRSYFDGVGGGSVAALNNLSESYLDDQYKSGTEQLLLSDIYVENASFLKMDYLSLSYNFSHFFKKKFGLSASVTVQNVFTLSGYKGLDPEVAGGIDNNLYPRPRIYSFGINFRL